MKPVSSKPRAMTYEFDAPYLDNWRKDFLEVMFKALKLESSRVRDTQLLEVGCGDGQWILEAGRVGAFSTGIDVSITALRRAYKWEKQLPEEARSRVSFVQADALHLPLKDSTFERIVSMQMIEHVQDDVGVITEIARVAKPRCDVFISTMNTIRRIPLLLWPLFQFHEIRAGHLRGYTHEKLGKSFGREGFLPYEVTYYTHPIKIVQDVFCARFRTLRRSNDPLWRKVTKLDLRFARLRTGWTFSIHLSRRS